MPIFVGLLLIMIAEVIWADEANVCATSCASNLKQCRNQANSAANGEAHPTFRDGRNVGNYSFVDGRNFPFDNQSRYTSIEVEKRREERSQQCESENKSCLLQCKSETVNEPSSPKKNSVIFK
jgi:hypothetical protein